MNLISKTRFLLFISVSFVLFGLSACKKKETDYPQTSVKLSIESASNGLRLTWDKVNPKDFIRYDVYRSSDPIPDPTPEEPISSQLKITTISNSDNNTFLDTTNAGKNYYRVEVVLKLRSIMSNSVMMGFGQSMKGNFQNAFICKNLKRIYFTSNLTSTMLYYDYANDSIVTTSKLLPTYTFTNTKNELGEDVVYGVSFSQVAEYDAATLNFKRYHTFSNSISANTYGIANGHLYMVKYPNLLTYDLTNDVQVDADAVGTSYMAYMSEQGNYILVTPSSGLADVYAFTIGSDGTPSLLKAFTDNQFNLANTAAVSPDGNYLVCRPGFGTPNLLDNQFNPLVILNQSNFFSYNDFLFAKNNDLVLGVTTSQLIQVFKRASGELLGNISMSPNAFSSNQGVFVDGDLLLTIENTFNSLTGESVIVLRKRTIDF